MWFRDLDGILYNLAYATSIDVVEESEGAFIVRAHMTDGPNRLLTLMQCDTQARARAWVAYTLIPWMEEPVPVVLAR